MKNFLFSLLCLLVVIGCEAPVLTYDPINISLYTEGTKQITTNAVDATFSIKDDYFATVSSTGLVTANKVGKTEVVINSSYGPGSVNVDVIPQYILYPDLDNLIGKGVSDMESVMGTSYKESTTSKGETMYTYENPTSYCKGIGFTFSGSSCKSIAVYVPTNHTTKITKALIERYTVAGVQNDVYLFLNHGENVLIGLTVYNYAYIGVAYVAYSKSTADPCDLLIEGDYEMLLE